MGKNVKLGEMETGLKKKDILLAAVLLGLAALLFLGLRLGGEKPGAQFRVMVDGKLYGTYSLLEEREIVVTQESGTNTIRVGDGAVWMAEADCPDGYCVRQGKRSRKNQTIVCLPHKLVIEVEGEAESGKTGEEALLPPDAVVH